MRAVCYLALYIDDNRYFVPSDFFPAVYGDPIPTQRSHNNLKCHFSCSLKSKFLLLGHVLAGNHTEIMTRT